MNTVLIGSTAGLFLYDILIVSQTAAEHFRKLKLIFSRLASTGLKVKLERCNFLQNDVSYLKYQIDRHGLRTLQSKVEAVINFPVVASVEKVRSFLGLTGYYKHFIKEHSDIAQPLSSLLKKNAAFTCGTAQKQAFETLKLKLTVYQYSYSPTILRSPY